MSDSLQERRLTFLAFSEFFLIGIGAVVLAPVLPSIIAEFGVGLATAGLLFPARSTGGLVAGFAAGPLVDRYGSKATFIGSMFLIVTGLAAVMLGHSWMLIVAGLTLASAGTKAVSTCLNSFVVAVNQEHSAKALNNSHGIYSTGALIAPIFIGLALTAGVGWRWMFLVPALGWAAAGMTTGATSFPRGAGPAVKKPVIDMAVVRSSLFLLLFTLSFCYNGIAVPLLGWVKTYMDQMGTFSAFFSTSMITVFYIALTAGRFLCGQLADRVGHTRTILLLALGMLVTYPLVIFGDKPLLFVPGVFFSGLFLSGVYPTALAMANKTFPEVAGTVTGMLGTAMTLGALAPPWWTGVIAEYAGFPAAMSANMVLVLALVAAAFGLVRMQAATPVGPVKAEQL